MLYLFIAVASLVLYFYYTEIHFKEGGIYLEQDFSFYSTSISVNLILGDSLSLGNYAIIT